MTVELAVTVGGGVLIRTIKVPHPTPCCWWICAHTVYSLLWAVNIYVCVCKVVCHLVFIQVALTVVPLKMDRFVTRKRVIEKRENNINKKPSTSRTEPNKASNIVTCIWVWALLGLKMTVLFHCVLCVATCYQINPWLQANWSNILPQNMHI